MRSKYLKLAAVLLSAALLPSCALLPEEEEIRTTPLLHSYQREEFEMTVAERGDLIEEKQINCTYVPVQTAALSFQLGGEYVDKMMVQVGDYVEEGQLLGQLQLGNLEERIESTKSLIEEQQSRLDYLREKYELDLKRNEIVSEALDVTAQQEALQALEESYADQFDAVANTIRTQKLVLEELEKDLLERRIYAPFAGMVTQVSKFDDGDMSVFGYRVVTVADSTMSLFRAETEYWDRFAPGDEYDIIVSKEPHAAVVKSEEELGIESTDKEVGKKEYVYFALIEPSFELEDGDRGAITIVLNEYLDVVHVPANAVASAGEQTIVYYQREDGMKAYKNVVVGATVDKRTEIISGLTEGESIIVD